MLQISWLRIVFASNKNFYFGIQYCRQRLVPLYWQHGLDLNKKCREEYKVRLIGSWALYCQWKICKFNTKLGFKVLSYKFYLMVSNFIWDWHQHLTKTGVSLATSACLHYYHPTSSPLSLICKNLFWSRFLMIFALRLLRTMKDDRKKICPRINVGGETVITIFQ